MMARVFYTICLLLTLNIGRVQGTGCPAFWSRIGSLCYRLVSSFNVDTLGFPSTYHASVTCRQFGGHLAYIDNMNSENEIFAIMRNMSIDSVPRKVYIGLVDVTRTRHFTWLNGHNMTYNDWAEGEPGNKGEQCVVIKSPYRTWLSPEETEWHDYPCCEQANIKHALCSREPYVYDEDLTDEQSVLEVICNTVDECSSNPCQHGATCHDHVTGYTCSCPFGYEGSHCQLEITCPLPNMERATLGDIAENIEDDPKYTVGSVMTVTCEKGFHFVDKDTSPLRKYNCTENGWLEITENNVICPPVPRWSGLIANVTSRYYGATVEYRCDKGMAFSDGEEIKFSACDINGNWTPPLAECIESEPLSQQIQFRKPAEASGAAILGVFGLTFLVAELCLFVLMDLNVWRKQLLLGYKNVKSAFIKKSEKKEFQPVPVQL